MYKKLLNILKEEINDNLGTILNLITENNESDLIELNEEILFIITGKNHAINNNITLNIGFPFSIFEKKIKIKEIYPHTVTFFLRGDKLRKIQNKYFLNELSKSFLIKYSEIDSFEFKNIIKKYYKKINKFLYIDNYNFMGDFAIGTYFLDSLKKNYKIKNNVILSKLYLHLSNENNIFEINRENILKFSNNRTILIIPNLLDNQMESTLKYLKYFYNGKNVLCYILGRDIIIDLNYNVIKIFKLKREEILLKKSNIYDYMDKVLEPFLINNKQIIRNKVSFTINLKSRKILISPFARENSRWINLEFFKNLVENLSGNFEIEILGGFRGHKEHMEYINEILTFTNKKNIILKILYINSLSYLNKKFSSKEYFLFICPDTSVNHYAVKYKQMTLSVYNKSHWNSKSMQALSGASPLGFNNFFHYNFPIIFEDNNSNETLKLILVFIKYLKKLKKSNYSISYDKKIMNLYEYKKLIMDNQDLLFLDKLYSPFNLVKDIIKLENISTKLLISSAVKTSPLYKITKYKKWY